MQTLAWVLWTGEMTWPSCLPRSASYRDLPSGDLHLWACTKRQGEDIFKSESRMTVNAMSRFREPVRQSKELSIQKGEQTSGWAGKILEGTDYSCYGHFCHQGLLIGLDQSVWIRNCWLCQLQTLSASAAQLLATLPPPSPG